MSSFSNNKRPIDELYNEYLKNFIDKNEYYSFFKKICEEFDSKVEKDLYKNHWEKATHRKILQVFERIKFTYLLEKDIDNNLVKSYLYYPAITYHLLTCFDSLGQPLSRIDFADWLISSKTKSERQSIIEKIEWKNQIEFARKMNLEYNSIYGVKSSFFNFLRNILPNETKLELFDQLLVKIYDESQNPQQISFGNITFKETYLYRIRNNYTHNIYSKEPLIDNSKSKSDEWLIRENYYKSKKKFHIFSNIHFYENLRKSVLIGIAEFIKLNNS